MVHVFDEQTLKDLPGHFAIGHVRYSTTGSSVVANAQPLVVRHRNRSYAVAHNGNLVNSRQLRRWLEANGSIFQTTSDTEVILHLKEAEKEFLNSWTIKSLISRYSDHIGFKVSLHTAGEEESKVVNSATALWTRSRTDVSDDEYKEFYKYLTHDFSDPLTWSHNRVEGKREYTSLLYIPAAAPFDLWNREAPRGLKLYVQRVFIMDDAEQFLPLYLRFVKGVVDSSDLPLNVSRELLQQNPELSAMRSALTKRVLDMLGKLAKGDEYDKFWSEFGQVLKEGVIEDFANKDKLAKLLRFASTHSGSEAQDQSLDDYVPRMQEG